MFLGVCWRTEFGLSKVCLSVYANRCLPWFSFYCCPTAATLLAGRVVVTAPRTGENGSFTERRVDKFRVGTFSEARIDEVPPYGVLGVLSIYVIIVTSRGRDSTPLFSAPLVKGVCGEKDSFTTR